MSATVIVTCPETAYTKVADAGGQYRIGFRSNGRMRLAIAASPPAVDATAYELIDSAYGPQVFGLGAGLNLYARPDAATGSMVVSVSGYPAV